MYKRILVPLDGSELGERALPQAQNLARTFGASLHLLQVVSRRAELEAVRGGSGADSPGSLEFTRERARYAINAQTARSEEYLRRVAARLGVSGVKVEMVVRHGTADKEIAEYATEEGMDIIAMSTHGYGGLRRLLMGSVTDRVIRLSKVPVLVLPSKLLR